MAKTNKQRVHHGSDSAVSRRSLLSGMAAMGSVVAMSSSAQDAPKTKNKKPDVIVIGGGLAGCVTARDLSHRGHKVILLEAQGRLGGRVFTSEFAGKTVELGALVLSWKQPFIWAEVTRYALEIEPIVGALTPERCYWITNGKSHSASPEEFFRMYVPPVVKFFADATRVFPYPYDPLSNRELVEEIDQLSVADRLRTLAAGEERDFADNWASAPLGRVAKDGGLASTLALTSSFGGVHASLEGASFRLKDGTDALVNKIVQDGGYEYRLQSPVASITQSETGVSVHIKGGDTLKASMLVLTVPVNTYKNIEFSPPLNSDKVMVSKGNMAGAQSVHINARIKGRMSSMLAVAPSHMPLYLLMTTDILEDSIIVDGYGADASMFSGGDPREVERAIRQWIPQAEVMESVSYPWHLDPYSQGTWCGFGPGILSKYYDGLREPEGRVYFASADSATAFRGYMEGAVESGVRVAAEVNRSLESSRTA